MGTDELIEVSCGARRFKLHKQSVTCAAYNVLTLVPNTLSFARLTLADSRKALLSSSATYYLIISVRLCQSPIQVAKTKYGNLEIGLPTRTFGNFKLTSRKHSMD